MRHLIAWLRAYFSWSWWLLFSAKETRKEALFRAERDKLGIEVSIYQSDIEHDQFEVLLEQFEKKGKVR